MTRKDYIKLADLLNNQFTQPHESATALAVSLVPALCEVLKADNPQFNQARFEQAVWKAEGK